MKKRRMRILKFAAIGAAVVMLAWGGSAIAVYAVSSGRVFDSANIDAVPHRRAAVVLGCVRTLPNGLNNLYFSRRIYAAAELYKAGKVDCLIVSGDNHVKGYAEPSDMKESLAKIAAVLDVILRRSPKFLGPREALPTPPSATKTASGALRLRRHIQQDTIDPMYPIWYNFARLMKNIPERG